MAYTADINIVVKGQAAVNALQKSLTQVGEKIDELAKKRLGFSPTLETFNKQLAEAKSRLNEVVAGTTNETAAIKNYVTALGNANAATERQNKLIQSEIDLREAATKNIKEFANVQAYLYEKQRQLENSKLDEKAARVQEQLDKQAAAAAESAAQIEKLNQRQVEFTARTDEAARAAARQTAEFIRQQRIAKEVAKVNANAPAPQLLLAPAAPGAPAMGGGARARITGPVERLGGARTQDQADMALRFAQALQQQVRPLSQIQYLYAGIASQAAKLQAVKALPDTAMLNASARGLQTIESIESKRLTRLERIRQKLQQIAEYEASSGTMANAGFGVQGPAVPPEGVKPSKGKRPPEQKKGRGMGSAISSAAIGGAFPLLFGQGAGAAVGGAIGGVAGELALGPAGGFAGSLIGTAVGAAADADAAVAKLADNLGLAGAAADQFSQSFRTAGVDLQAFTQAVNGIRELNVTLEQQATAIELATAVSGNYKGSITAVATALQDVGTNGEVSLGTIQTLTAGNVPIVKSLASTYGVTKDKILEMAADGKISVAQLVEELRKLGNQQKEQTALDKLSESFSKLTKSAIKVFGPVLEEVGKILGVVLDKISTGFGYVADVLMPQFGKAVAPIKNALAGIFPEDLLGKVIGFFQDKIIRALEGVIYIIGKLSPVVAFVLNKFKELSSTPVFKFIAEQVGRLVNFLNLSGTYTDEYAKKQANAGAQTATTANKAKDLAAALARASTLQLDKSNQVLTATKEILSAEENVVNARIPLATSLNEEVGLLDQAAQIRQQINDAELQAAYNAAAATVQQAVADGASVDAARDKAALQIQAAESKYAEATITAEIATKQKVVAAYAEEYARQTERAAQAAERQTAAITNQLNVLTTVNQAQMQINDAQVQMLRMRLEDVNNTGQKLYIIRQIYDLERANAQLTYETTVAQIKAEVARQEIAYSMVKAKFAELNAVVQLAVAQGVTNKAYVEALNAQRIALLIAEDTLNATYKMADAQLAAADAVYKTNLALLDQKQLQEQGTAAATSKFQTGQFSGTSTQVSTYREGTMSAATYMYRLEEAKKAMTLKERIDNYYATYGAKTAFASGGYVTGATSALIGEAGPEYVIPAGKMDEAMARYASGRRGSSVIPDAAATGAGDYSAGASSINPVVNVTTGPVMNMNNSNYVSQADFLAGLQSASRQGAQMALATLQNSSSMRRAVGVR